MKNFNKLPLATAIFCAALVAVPRGALALDLGAGVSVGGGGVNVGGKVSVGGVDADVSASVGGGGTTADASASVGGTSADASASVGGTGVSADVSVGGTGASADLGVGGTPGTPGSPGTPGVTPGTPGVTTIVDGTAVSAGLPTYLVGMLVISSDSQPIGHVEDVGGEGSSILVRVRLIDALNAPVEIVRLKYAEQPRAKTVLMLRQSLAQFMARL